MPRAAPIGRPTTTQPSDSDIPEKEAPKSVQDAYQKLKSKWKRGVKKIERIYCTRWYKIHVIDIGATDNQVMPCPRCGFDSITKPQGWITKPRVAHGITSTEYFVGRRYACVRCKDKKKRNQVRHLGTGVCMCHGLLDECMCLCMHTMCLCIHVLNHKNNT